MDPAEEQPAKRAKTEGVKLEQGKAGPAEEEDRGLAQEARLAEHTQMLERVEGVQMQLEAVSGGKGALGVEQQARAHAHARTHACMHACGGCGTALLTLLMGLWVAPGVGNTVHACIRVWAGQGGRETAGAAASGRCMHARAHAHRLSCSPCPSPWQLQDEEIEKVFAVEREMNAKRR